MIPWRPTETLNLVFKHHQLSEYKPDPKRAARPPLFVFFVTMMEKDTERETVNLHKTAGSSVRRPEGVAATKLTQTNSPAYCSAIVVILCIPALKQ